MMIIDHERKESEFIWTGGLSASGCQEPNAISCVHLKCIMLAIMMCDNALNMSEGEGMDGGGTLFSNSACGLICGVVCMLYACEGVYRVTPGSAPLVYNCDVTIIIIVT